jgi:hypothetical protein
MRLLVEYSIRTRTTEYSFVYTLFLEGFLDDILLGTCHVIEVFLAGKCPEKRLDLFEYLIE